MTGYALRRSYLRREPPSSWVYDRRHPLARGMLLYLPMNEGAGIPRDMPGFIARGIFQGQPTWRSGPHGQSMNSTSSSSYIGLGAGVILRPSLPVSMFAIFMMTDLSTNNFIWGNDSASNASGYSLQTTNSGQLIIMYGDNTGTGATGYRRKESTTILQANQWYRVIGTMRAATDMDLYIDGINDGGSYVGSGGTVAYGGAARMLASQVAGGRFINGGLGVIAMWNRALTTAEVDQISNDPFCVMQPPAPWFSISIPADAGPATTSTTLFIDFDLSAIAVQVTPTATTLSLALDLQPEAAGEGVAATTLSLVLDLQPTATAVAPASATLVLNFGLSALAGGVTGSTTLSLALDLSPVAVEVGVTQTTLALGLLLTAPTSREVGVTLTTLVLSFTLSPVATSISGAVAQTTLVLALGLLPTARGTYALQTQLALVLTLAPTATISLATAVFSLVSQFYAGDVRAAQPSRGSAP